MFTAPLAFLRGRVPRRTMTWHQNPYTMEDSQDRTFSIEFYTPTPPRAYLSKQVFPSKKVQGHDSLSLFNPPPHYHLLQDEYFRVASGAGIWHLWGGKSVHLKKGDEIMVPPWKWHWFESAPHSEELFSVMYRYDAEYAEMEERFFRNIFGYQEDCRKAGIKPSIVQLLVFCMHNWMLPGFPISGPERLNLLVNTTLIFVIGGFGQFLLGYKAFYPEYYPEDGNRKN